MDSKATLLLVEMLEIRIKNIRENTYLNNLMCLLIDALTYIDDIIAEQIIQINWNRHIVTSLNPNQFQKPSLYSMDTGKSELSGNYNRTA